MVSCLLRARNEKFRTKVVDEFVIPCTYQAIFYNKPCILKFAPSIDTFYVPIYMYSLVIILLQ